MKNFYLTTNVDDKTHS